MALLIQKFGGTSVGNIERIKAVAEKVIRSKQQGHEVVLVVSAMQGVTDQLIQLAGAMQTIPDAREYAVLVTTGEQVAVSLLAMALIERGYPARSYSGGQVPVRVPGDYMSADNLAIDVKPLKQVLSKGIIPVVAGFQGVKDNGDMITLGRGGSDLTAVALAAALQADECQIYTDVEGVYSADPKVVPNAKRFDTIDGHEMLYMAAAGAKVLQKHAVEMALECQVPVRVLSSFTEGPGTLIIYGKEDEPARMAS